MEGWVNFRNMKIETKSILSKYVTIRFLDETFLLTQQLTQSSIFFVTFIICKRESCIKSGFWESRQ